jgi:hypothetical protein
MLRLGRLNLNSHSFGAWRAEWMPSYFDRYRQHSRPSTQLKIGLKAYGSQTRGHRQQLLLRFVRRRVCCDRRRLNRRIDQLENDRRNNREEVACHRGASFSGRLRG